MNSLSWLTLTVYGLACFRIAVLLSTDIGPWGVFSRLRAFLKREAREHTAVRRSKVHTGILCVRCDSMWIAAPVAAFALWHDELPSAAATFGDLFLLWSALSALAILVHRALPKR